MPDDPEKSSRTAMPRRRPLKGLGLPIFGIAVILSTPSMTAYITQRVDDIYLQRRLAFEAHQKQVELSLIRQERETFLDQQVNPILQAALKKNHEAVARAKDRLTSSIERYRSGIEPFIGDLRSWSTEYGIITKSILELWYKDGRFDRFMEEKFAAHLFTDNSIAAHVANARRQLVEDIEANQNQVLVELTNASTSLKMRMPPAWPDSEAFSKEVSGRARTFVGHSTIMYEVGSNATMMLIPTVVDIAVRAAAKAAATRAGTAVLAEAGTVAAGAGDGSAAGSEVPVIGNVIGFGVGLFVSYLAVSYEQARADDGLRQNISNYIETLKVGIIGSENAPSEIIRSMNDYVDQIDAAERQIITQDVMALNDETVK